MQYTLRGISRAFDKAIRRRAREKGKSLNEATLEALADGLGFGEEAVVRRDLSDIVGTWRSETPVEKALAAQDVVDKAPC
jgi:Zn/Cd-binding protein ZinT